MAFELATLEQGSIGSCARLERAVPHLFTISDDYLVPQAQWTPTRMRPRTIASGVTRRNASATRATAAPARSAPAPSTEAPSRGLWQLVGGMIAGARLSACGPVRAGPVEDGPGPAAPRTSGSASHVTRNRRAAPPSPCSLFLSLATPLPPSRPLSLTLPGTPTSVRALSPNRVHQARAGTPGARRKLGCGGGCGGSGFGCSSSCCGGGGTTFHILLRIITSEYATRCSYFQSMK
jgi:hypothetical protein